MIYKYNDITIVFLVCLTSSFLNANIVSDNIKEMIWFETIPPSNINVSIPIPIPLPRPISSLSFPLNVSIPTKWKPIKTESIYSGDEIIIQKRGAIRSVVGVFEYYDINSKRLFINCGDKPNTILLDDILVIRLKLPGEKRETFKGATLGLILGMLIGGVENNGTGNQAKALSIVGRYTLSGVLLGTLFTSPKSRRLIKFNHDRYEYKVVYND